MSANPQPQKYTLSDGSVRWKIRYRTADRRSTDKGGFRTKAEANAWWMQNAPAIVSGQAPSNRAGRVAVHTLVEQHLSRTVRLKPSTVAQRESHAHKWVLPWWEGRPAAEVTRTDVEKWVSWMIEKGAGAPTVNKAHQLLSQVFNRAVDDRVIAANPATRVALPREAPRKHPYLTLDELDELLGETDPRYRSLVTFLAFTGLRFGEAAALRVGDVDYARRRVSVHTAVSEVRGHIHVDGTKNHRARTVALPSFVLDVIRPNLVGKRQSDLVFQSPRGRTLRLSSWRPRFFNKAVQSVNEQRRMRAEASGALFEPFPKVTPHDMRHTAASLAVLAGGNVKTIQRNLGHANAAMTLNVYAGILDNDLDDVANSLHNLAAGHPLGRVEAS